MIEYRPILVWRRCSLDSPAVRPPLVVLVVCSLKPYAECAGLHPRGQLSRLKPCVRKGTDGHKLLSSEAAERSLTVELRIRIRDGRSAIGSAIARVAAERSRSREAATARSARQTGAARACVTDRARRSRAEPLV